MHDEYSSVVVTDWDNLECCMFSRKCWVNPQNVDIEKSYEKGDFLRVYCDHDGTWCSCETDDLDFCVIYTDHNNE